MIGAVWRLSRWLLGILGQEDPRRENVLRIGQTLQLPHKRGEFCAPFALDKRRDVAPGAVLGLERTVVFPDHEIDDVGHELAVALNLFRIVQEWRDQEVQVSG